MICPNCNYLHRPNVLSHEPFVRSVRFRDDWFEEVRCPRCGLHWLVPAQLVAEDLRDYDEQTRQAGENLRRA